MPFPIEAFRNLSENVFGMPESIEVLRATRAPDNEGGFTNTLAVVATVPGRFCTASARDIELGSSMQAAVEGVITVPHDADVRSTDRLRRAGQTYAVAGVLTQTADFAAHLEVLVRRA